MVVAPVVSLLWAGVTVVEPVDNADTTARVTPDAVRVPVGSQPVTVEAEPRR